MHIYVGFEFELAVQNNQTTIKNWHRFPTGLDAVLRLVPSMHELLYSVPVAVILSAACKIYLLQYLKTRFENTSKIA